MNIDEAAKALGVSTKTLRSYIKKGIIEARLVIGKTGKEYEIEPSSIEAYKNTKEAGTIYPTLEGVEKPGIKIGRSGGKAIARMEKAGTLEIKGVQSLPISLGPSRSSEEKGRYLDALPDVCNIEEAAIFLGVSISTVRDYLRTGKLRGLKLGKGWKISKESLKTFVKELLG